MRIMLSGRARSQNNPLSNMNWSYWMLLYGLVGGLAALIIVRMEMQDDRDKALRLGHLGFAIFALFIWPAFVIALIIEGINRLDGQTIIYRPRRNPKDIRL